MKQLSQQQTQLLVDLTNEFQKLNESMESKGDFNYLNVSAIMENENKHTMLKKEIELHNQAMNKQAKTTLILIADKLDDDFCKAGMQMVTELSSGNTYLKVIPLDKDGERMSRFDVNDGISIQMNAKYQSIDGIQKIVGYTYSHSYDSLDNTQFEKVEDYLNSERFVKRISHIYRKYLAPK